MSISRSRRVETADQILARLDREVRELRATLSARSAGTLIDLTPYTKKDGSRAFTGVVVGITPTLAAHLATKGYVDGAGAGDPAGYLGFTVEGDLETGDIGFRWIAPFDLTLVGLQIAVGGVSSGASIKVDAHDDGVTAFSTKAEIAIGANDSTVATPSAATVAAGSVITIEIDQVGSGDPGSNLLGTLEYTVNAGAAAGASHFSFSVFEELATGPRPFRFIAPFDFTIVGIQVTAGIQPTTTSIVSDWNKEVAGSPVTLFTVPGDRPEILTSTNDSAQEVPAVTAITAGDVLTWDVDQKDSADVGRYLTTIMEITVP